MSSIINSGAISRHRVASVAPGPLPSPHSRTVGRRRTRSALGWGVSARLGGGVAGAVASLWGEPGIGVHVDVPRVAAEASVRPILTRQTSGPDSR